MRKRFRRTASLPAVVVSGDALVADFVTAMTNLTTAEVAKYTAEQSEHDTISTIRDASQGTYVDPVNFSAGSQESLVQSSLNAHIQKVQADQLSSFTHAQIVQMEAEIKHKYSGKKLLVTVLDPIGQPIESQWHNSRTGQYGSGQMTAAKIKGIVEDVSLTKNVLLLRPTFAARVILPSRKYYAVYIVNPNTLTPMVRLTVL